MADVHRGEIWWANLPEPRRSEHLRPELGFRRPVLVVQADAFNRSRIQTVIVAAITSNLELPRPPATCYCRPARRYFLATRW